MPQEDRLKEHPFVAQMQEAREHKRKSMTRIVWVTVAVIALLLVALTVSLIVDLAGRKIRYTLEAGDELPSAASLCGRAGAAYESELENLDLIFERRIWNITILPFNEKINNALELNSPVFV